MVIATLLVIWTRLLPKPLNHTLSCNNVQQGSAFMITFLPFNFGRAQWLEMIAGSLKCLCNVLFLYHEASCFCYQHFYSINCPISVIHFTETLTNLFELILFSLSQEMKGNRQTGNSFLQGICTYKINFQVFSFQTFSLRYGTK